MELKYCSVLNNNCKELNGILSSQQSHLGIVDIGYYSFSYYEITNDKKLLNAKVYTWDELYDIIGCPAETLCPVNSINDNNYYNRGTRACKTICPSVLSCKDTGNNAYILTIVVTVLLGLILVIYCVYGVGGYRWAICLTFACFAINLSSLLIFPSRSDCLLPLQYGVNGAMSVYYGNQYKMKGRAIKITIQVLLFLSIFIQTVIRFSCYRREEQTKEFDRITAKESGKPLIYQDEHVHTRHYPPDSGCFDLDYHENSKLFKMSEVHVKALWDDNCFHRGAKCIIDYYNSQLVQRMSVRLTYNHDNKLIKIYSQEQKSFRSKVNVCEFVTSTGSLSDLHQNGLAHVSENAQDMTQIKQIFPSNPARSMLGSPVFTASLEYNPALAYNPQHPEQFNSFQINQDQDNQQQSEIHKQKMLQMTSMLNNSNDPSASSAPSAPSAPSVVPTSVPILNISSVSNVLADRYGIPAPPNPTSVSEQGVNINDYYGGLE
jgi:hypothetical protein